MADGRPQASANRMTRWPTKREPAKTKAELQEMLAEAVRNTQPQEAETKPPPKPKKERG